MDGVLVVVSLHKDHRQTAQHRQHNSNSGSNLKPQPQPDTNRPKTNLATFFSIFRKRVPLVVLDTVIGFWVGFVVGTSASRQAKYVCDWSSWNVFDFLFRGKISLWKVISSLDTFHFMVLIVEMCLNGFAINI